MAIPPWLAAAGICRAQKPGKLGLWAPPTPACSPGGLGRQRRAPAPLRRAPLPGQRGRLAVEVNLFCRAYNTLLPHRALDERTRRAAYIAVEHAVNVWPLADPLLDWEVLT
jgi:hypothetical protein